MIIRYEGGGRLKPYNDPVVLPIHAPRRCEPLTTLWLWGCARTSTIGRHLPKPDLTRAKGESSRCICWQLWAWSPVPTPAGTKGGLWLGRACLPTQRCTSDLRTTRGKFLPQRSRFPRQTASFQGLAAQSACPSLCPVAWGAAAKNSYRSIVGFHGKLPLSRGWLPRARALASVLWRQGAL